MSPRTHLPRTRRVGTAVLMGVVLSVLAASPVLADAPPTGSSRAQANGLAPYLLGGNILIPPATATNDGTIHPYETNGAGAIFEGLPSFLAAGVVGQLATAYPQDTTELSSQGQPLVSAACAGVISSSSAIQIGSTGQCDADNGPQDGIRIDLGLSGLASIGLRGGALYSSCTIDQAGNWTASAHGINLRFVSTTLGIETTLFPIDISTPPNTGLDLSFVGQALLNNVIVIGGSQDGQWISAQDPIPEDADGIQTNALVLTVLGTGFRLGQSTCYKSIAGPAGPMIPAEGVPYALATLALAAGGFVIWRQRAVAPAL